MLPRYTRMMTATTQTMESDAHVLIADCQEKSGMPTNTTTMPAVTTNPATTARLQWSKATVANEATITAHTAACVNSYPATLWTQSSAVPAVRDPSGDSQSAAREIPLATVRTISAAPSSR